LFSISYWEVPSFLTSLLVGYPLDSGSPNMLWPQAPDFRWRRFQVGALEALTGLTGASVRETQKKGTARGAGAAGTPLRLRNSSPRSPSDSVQGHCPQGVVVT
jgi:hypothetical protein